MSQDDEKHWLTVVAAPAPPEALTAMEVQNLSALVREHRRKAERRAARNQTEGRVLAGADIEALRSRTLAILDAKLDGWMTAAYVSVNDAKALQSSQLSMEVEAEGETVGEARWKAVQALREHFTFGDDSDVEVQVISEGVRGMLGQGREPARVIARLRPERVA